MVEFLLNASAVLIESITGKAHDMEGIHDRPRAGELFNGSVFEPGESIHSDDLNALAPPVGLEGQPGFQDPLGSARDHVQEPGGTTTVSHGSYVQDNGDVFVAVRGVAPHVFIHANDTHPFTPCWIIDQQVRPFGQDTSVSGIPGHAQGLGDARHRQMVDHHARHRPAHRRPRELGTRIGYLAHVLTPHMSTLPAPVATHAHIHNSGMPPAGLVRQAPDHRVPRNTLAPAASTPPVLTSNPARQYSTVWPNALTRHLQPQAI